MLNCISTPDRGVFRNSPALRGYHAVYREHQVNHCPGCGRTHWHIGRLLAECGFCATALPLDGNNRHAFDWDQAAAA